MKPLHSNKAPTSNGGLASKNGHETDVLERPQTLKNRKDQPVQDATMTDTHRLLQAILDNIPDRIYFKDTQSRFLRLSQSLAHRLGVNDPALAIGKTDFDFNPSENAREYYQDEQRVMETGRPLINKTERQILPNGEIGWTSTTKVPLRDAEGRVIGLVGINRDITAQKRTEEALRQSYEELEKRVAERTTEISGERQLLRTLVDNLPDYVYVKDGRGRFILANMAVARQMGFSSPEEIIGKTDFDLFPHDLAAQYRAEEEEMARSGKELHSHEGPSVDASRKEKNRWISTTKVVLRDGQGKVTGFIGLGRDITERKEAEEALSRERSLLRTLIDNIPDCIYAKDDGGRKILANPADLKNYHCQTEAEALGKTDFDLFPREIAEKFHADDQRVIQGQPVINREEYFLSDEGQKQWLLTSKLPLRDPNGKIVGLVGIGRDITEQKEAQDALRASEAKLRQSTVQLGRSNRELQDFAYVASHDLQEPLRKIVVFGERLKEQSAEKLDPESRDYLERMQKAASRMQTLINDLLSFSRVTTKAQPFRQVDLAEVAREVVADLEGRIEMVKGRVEIGTLPLIEAEPVQMRQLLQNLIGNSLKFRRPETPPVVKVAAEIITGAPSGDGTALAGKICRLTVSDNGIGFEEKYLDRIFNVFQRLHSRNEYEGTGMGLAIARKIAVFHRGEITARSKPGEGATFIVTLPVTHPREPQTTGENHE